MIQKTAEQFTIRQGSSPVPTVRGSLDGILNTTIRVYSQIETLESFLELTPAAPVTAGNSSPQLQPDVVGSLQRITDLINMIDARLSGIVARI